MAISGNLGNKKQSDTGNLSQGDPKATYLRIGYEVETTGMNDSGLIMRFRVYLKYTGSTHISSSGNTSLVVKAYMGKDSSHQSSYGTSTWSGTLGNLNGMSNGDRKNGNWVTVTIPFGQKSYYIKAEQTSAAYPWRPSNLTHIKHGPISATIDLVWPYVWITNSNGEWKRAVPWIYKSDAWHAAIPWVRWNDYWRTVTTKIS